MNDFLVKKANLGRDEQCLKNSGYECACWMADIKVRKPELSKLRQNLGAYSFMNLLDEGVAGAYQREKVKLCQGNLPPTLIERLKWRFWVK